MKNIILALLLILTFGVNAFAESKRIAVVKSRQIQFYWQFLMGFKSSLKASGNNIVIDQYDLENDDSLDKIKNGGYSVVCPLGTAATKAVEKEITDKPIVFSMLMSPVASNIVAAMSPSGSRITGMSLNVDVETQFKLLKKIIPSVKTIGALYSSASAEIISQAQAKAAGFGLKLETARVDSNLQVPSALSQIAGKIDVLWLIPDSTVCYQDSLTFMISYSVEHKLPAMAFAPYLVKAGGAFCYAIDYESIGNQTAEIIVKILDGESPGNMPIAVPRKINYTLNAKSADYFGIRFSPDVIDGAAEVYR